MDERLSVSSSGGGARPWFFDGAGFLLCENQYDGIYLGLVKSGYQSGRRRFLTRLLCIT